MPLSAAAGIRFIRPRRSVKLIRMRCTFKFWLLTIVAVGVTTIATHIFAYDTIGNGYGSKWGEDPSAGTGAIITWGYMPDGTSLDPTGFPFNYAVTGTSNITALRNSVDVNYGAGAFNQAIQDAFNSWSAIANITFVGPIADAGLPVGSTNAITPNIRIGGFQAVPNQFFQHSSAMGLGPPGPSGQTFSRNRATSSSTSPASARSARTKSHLAPKTSRRLMSSTMAMMWKAFSCTSLATPQLA